MDITDAMATFIEMPVGVLEQCFQRLVSEGMISATEKNDIFTVCKNVDLRKQMEGLVVGEDRASGEEIVHSIIKKLWWYYLMERSMVLSVKPIPRGHITGYSY